MPTGARVGAWTSSVVIAVAIAIAACSGEDRRPPPIDDATLVPPADEDSLRLRDILLRASRYALTTWYQERGYLAQSGEYLILGDGPPDHVDSPTGEHRLRGAGSMAMAVAVALALGLHDESVTGVSRETAEARALLLIRSLAFRHLSNSPDGWGRGWQTSLWAAYAATAAWLLWERLTDLDRQLVVRMVEEEARRLVGYEVPYYKNELDQLVWIGDSKAEENAWNAQFLYLAVNLLPQHPMRPAWEYKAAELSVSAFARAADRVRTDEVGGRPLSHWLRGSNVEDDGSVINHWIIHPDYMSTAANTAAAPIWYGLAGRPTPDTMFVGVSAVYAALVDLEWPSGEFEAPGGTIYIDGSDAIYFPQGTDWGRARRINFAFFDVIARHFELDGEASVAAEVWEDLHAQAALAMQARSSDGRTYVTADEDAYFGREEWVAAHAALGYLVAWVAAQGAYQRTDAFVPVVLDNQDLELGTGGQWMLDTPAGRIGDTSLVAPAAGASGTASARWATRSPLPAGWYRVSAWWATAPHHAVDARFTIGCAGEDLVVRVNQRKRGGRWNALGTCAFDGTAATGAVELSNQTATGVVVADAVMFERLVDLD
jgi:hypothetical protein